MQQKNLLVKLVGITALLTYGVIVLGAATRVFDAGMSCPDWPLCYGHLLPFPAPEGGYVVGTTVYAWWQVALEWFHRLFAAITGFFLLAAFGVAAVAKRRRVMVYLGVAVALLIVQIKLGGLTVFQNNIHWSVAAHLGVAMLFFGSLITARRVAGQEKAQPIAAPAVQKGLLWVVAALVWCTMVVGAMVSSAYAGGACGGLFSCQGVWLPDDFQQIWHMKHRYLALATTVAIVAFFFVARRGPKELYKTARGFKVLLLGQIGLGVLTLCSFSYYAHFYHLLSLVHLAWGTLLWMAAAGALGKLYLGTAGGFHRAE